jgi:predicted Zn-dependent protease
MLRSFVSTRLTPLVAAASLLAPAAVLAEQQGPTQVKPGFNLFSVQQDVQVGRQAAAQAERQLRLARGGRSEELVEDLVARLAPHAPGADYPYQAKVVAANDVNAFALPGGYMYVYQGVIRAARTEGELAGVLAHEMAHVALRHGTHQASKQYATQAGLGLLGGLLTRGRGGANGDLVNVVGSLGMSAVFMKFTRDMETQADVVGAQMMAAAGYDPMEMVSFFEMLARRGDRGGFFSDHPRPSDRAERVRQEARAIGAPSHPSGNQRLRLAQADSGRATQATDRRRRLYPN